MKNIIFIAPPAAGKGTMSEIIKKKYGYKHISTGDILRSMAKSEDDFGRNLSDLLKQGGLISDDIVNEALKRRLSMNDLDNGYVIYEDRRDAIKFAIENRKVGDVICVMGKGHEPMMEMNGEKIRFLDREVILEIIDELHI